jgi:hypothetical protein
MRGLGAALENLDDDHASAAAWAREREGGRLVAIVIIGICSLALGLDRIGSGDVIIRPAAAIPILPK